MPKGMKTAPPQQASLNELWSGKGKKSKKEDASPQPAAVSPKLEEKDVEMNDEKVKKVPRSTSS